MRITISRSIKLEVGQRIYIGAGGVGTSSILLGLNIKASDAQALRLTPEEGDELTNWTPVGLAIQLVGTGTSSLTIAGFTKRYNRVACDVIGTGASTVVCDLSVEASGA
jgi:hypothetical protein